jgi:hypothetical protein
VAIRKAETVSTTELADEIARQHQGFSPPVAITASNRRAAAAKTS